MNARLLLFVALLAFLPAAHAQSVSSAPVRGAVELVAPDLLVPKHSLIAQQYRLLPLGDDELALLRNRNAEQKLLYVGVARALPVDGGVPLDALAWHALPDGSRVTTLEFASPDAAALRVSFAAGAFPEGVTLRTYAATGAGYLHGAVDAKSLAGSGAEAWLPEQPGESIGVELHATAGADLRGARLPVLRLMHIVVTPSDWDSKRLNELGNAGLCNIDIACAPNDWMEVGRAVAKYLFNPDPNSLALCTGTLLNNIAQVATPYMATARHCITGATQAASMTYYWHFERATCGGADPTSVIQTTGGAQLLATATAQDMVLLVLNNAPPVSALLAGWNANTPQRNVPVVALHHPKGDLKMYTLGTIDIFTAFSGTTHADTSPYLRTHWSQGTTEQGSSGSALFNDTGQLIGTLRGGLASCDALTDPDYYGRFDQAYPSFTTWLGGTAPTPTPTPTPPPAGGGGGGGHGGLLLLAGLAWWCRPRSSAWRIRSNSSATRSGKRSPPTRS